MRTFFLLMGLVSAVPQVWFLLLHKFGVPWIPKRCPAVPFRLVMPRKWKLATAIRLISVAALLTGIRMFLVNSINIDRPITFSSWFDSSAAVATTALSALASTLFVIVFMRYRDWDA